MSEETQENQEKVSILKKLKINNIAEKNKKNSISLQFMEKSAQVKQRLLQEIKTLSSLILMKVGQQLLMKDQM